MDILFALAKAMKDDPASAARLSLRGKKPTLAKEKSPEGAPKVDAIGGICGGLRKLMVNRGIENYAARPTWKREGNIHAKVEFQLPGKPFVCLAFWNGRELEWQQDGLAACEVSRDDITTVMHS